MEKIVIMCRSLTYAQAAARTLERGGIVATVVKVPQTVSGTGCRYGVQLRWAKLEQALGLLQKQGKPYGKIFRYLSDGSLEEVQP